MQITAPLALLIAISVVTPLAGAQVPDLYEPTAYRTIYLSFSQPNWWNLLLQNYAPEIDIPADMTVDGVTYPNVGVRFRGNTSYFTLPPGSEKKSFNIRTDAFVPGQDLYGYDHLNLNNGFHDPTFLREFLTYMVSREYGPAPGCNFVKLYLNGQYWGVYINVQQPNKDMAAQWWRSNGGNRYRGFPTSGGFNNGRCALTWLGSNVSDYLSAYQAKQGDGQDLMQLCNVLNNTPVSNIESALPVIFSLDQFYRYAAVMNIMTQTDSYIGSGKDHFLYHDDVYGQFHVFPFDLNESLQESATLSPWFNTTSSIKPAFSKTFPILAWKQRYLAHYRTIAEDTFSWAVLGPIITQFHAMIAPDVMADTKKIYTTQQFLDNVTLPVTIPGGGPFGGSTTVPALQTLIQSRDAYLSSHIDLTVPRVTLSQLQHTPATPTSTQSVTITVQASSAAQSVELWRRIAGPFTPATMFDDGQHGDGSAGDGVWGAIIPPLSSGTLVDYYVAAATSTGTLTFLPRTAEHLANSYLVGWPAGSSPVRINELLAKNNTVIADPAGEYEDFIELYNDAPTATPVGGMYLTDDLTNATKWQIPAGEIIAPYGTLLVWCDEDGVQGPLHASFKLSASGEVAALFDINGQSLLDSLAFGSQLADVSTGRFTDGGAPWVTFDLPTPDALNDSGCGLRTFSALDPTTLDIQLGGMGQPSVGMTTTASITGGPAGAIALLVLGPGAAHLPVPANDFPLLVDPTLWFLGLPVALDAAGAGGQAFPIPAVPALVGARVVLQAAAQDISSLRASNGLDIVICP